MENECLDRVLEIFYRLLHGEVVPNRLIAEEYGISSKSVSRDIGRINDFLAEHRDLMQNAEVTYSHKDRAYILKSDEFLKNQELFALVKVILGARCFSKEDMLSVVSKLKKFTTANDRKLLDEVIRREIYHYHEVRSDCDSVIDNLWRLVQCIDGKKVISVTYLKMDRSEVVRKLKPAAIMFSEYYFYLAAFIEGIDKKEHFKNPQDNSPTIYRIDRIQNCKTLDRHFAQRYANRFQEGEMRKRIQFMYGGELQTICFEYTGPSLESVLDRLPTAKVLQVTEKGWIVEAEVFGTGIQMWIRSQGDYVNVISEIP